jgi:hypothetical protein
MITPHPCPLLTEERELRLKNSPHSGEGTWVEKLSSQRRGNLG